MLHCTQCMTRAREMASQRRRGGEKARKGRRRQRRGGGKGVCVALVLLQLELLLPHSVFGYDDDVYRVTRVDIPLACAGHDVLD